MRTTLRFTRACLMMLSCLTLLCLSQDMNAQTTLVAGDIAFTGYNSNNNGSGGQNDFSFVILRTGGISAGTTINFTDNGYKGTVSNALGTTEGTLAWTSTAAMAQFTQVYVRIEPNAGASVLSISAGSIAGGFSNFILSQAGDQIFAYQGTSASPNFISGIHMNNESTTATSAAWDNLPSGTVLNSSRSDIPPALTNGVNAIMVVPSPSTASSEKDNGVYNCTGSTGASLAAIAAAINNVANWNIQDVMLYSIPPSCSFGIASPLSATTSFTNVSCNGGTNGRASVAASGGAGGYTYSWAPSGGTASLATGLSAGVYTVTVTDAASASTTATVSVSQPSAISATTSFTSVSCNGGSNGRASVSVSGGSSPYFYSWSPSGGTASLAAGLTAGSYTVTITDNNSCVKTQAVVVTQPPALSAVLSSTNVSCNGGNNGAASVSVGGGTPSYFYSWAPSGGTGSTATALVAGNYTVTVTDNNSCTRAATVAVTQPSALITSTAVNNVACNGGSTGVASITASGGAGGYSYLWSTGSTSQTITGLVAGVYTATVTDANSCTSVRSALVTQPSAIATTTAVANPSCNGVANGSASVTASGGVGGYTYSWAPSGGTAAIASGLSAGNYTVTVTDANNCAKTALATITQPAAIATTTAVTNVRCNGVANGSATVTATGGTGALSYNWAPSGGTTAVASGLSAGSYTVTITDANSCTKTAFATITQPSAITTTTALTNVSCNGVANGSATVTATGGTGAYVYAWTPSGGTASVATSLAAGNYTITVTDANSCAKTAFATITQPSAMVATPSQTNATCGSNNGAASVSVTGGTGSYTYSWLPSGGTASTATGLGTGNYTVTVTDANSCTKTQGFAITASGSISGVISTTSVSCNGGSNGTASVAASGGTGAYTYTWTPGGANTATAASLTAGIYTVQVKDATSCTVSFTANVAQPAALSLTLSASNVTCNGAANGSVTASVSGGTGAYSYTWSPSGGNAATATGLNAGTYTLQVKDANNCTASQTLTISQPAALTAAVTGTNVLCNGGANGMAAVTVSGGTGSYTYSWTPAGGTAATATSLGANNYTVIVKDANLCSLTRTIAITEPVALAAVTSQTNVSCNNASNGAASIVVSGGTGSYTYSWTPSGGTASTANGLVANNYTVTVKDANNCSIVRSYTITQPAALSLALSASNVTCNGAATGSVTASVNGGTGAYSYTWSPSGGNTAAATGLSPGTYSLTVKDANLCQASATVSITQPAALTSTLTTANASCNGSANGSATVSVAGGTGAYSYTWSPSGGNTAAATGLGASNYTVTVKDANNCTLSRTLTITQPAAIVSSLSYTNVSCFGQANGSASVSVSGGTGSLSYTWTPGGSTTSSITGLSAGVYTIQVKDAANCQLSSTVAISEPAAIVRTQSLSICQGQSVTVGSSTYTASGTYTNVLTTANGCDSTVTTILTVGPPPALTVTASSATVCAGNTTSLTASGATTYTWSNGVSNGAGFAPATTQTYTVTGANGGCVSTATISIYVNPKPTVMANATATLICNGSSVTLSGSGASTYTWTGGVSNGAAFSPSITASYTVTGTSAASCTNAAVVTVSVAPCTGIAGNSLGIALSVNPNPMTNYAIISISHFDQLGSAKLSLDLYDNTGRMVKQVSLTEADTVLHREDLADGLYYYHIRTGESTMLKGKLLVH